MTRLTLAIIILAIVALACGSQIPISPVKEVRTYKHAPEIDVNNMPKVAITPHVLIGVAYLFETRQMEAEIK